MNDSLIKRIRLHMNSTLPRITLATWITLIRFLFIPLVLTALIVEHPEGNRIAFFLFLLAMLSDSIDGFVARRFNQVSDLGKFLDPLADKLLVLPTLMVLSLRGLAPLLPSLIILARELTVIVWRWRALRQGRSFSASVAAKIKTDCLTAGVALLLIFPYSPWPVSARALGEAALYCGALMAVYSALDYIPLRRSNQKKVELKSNTNI